MTANNYLALVISPQYRRTHGPLREYYYPFDSGDMRSIARAREAAEAKRRHIEFYGVDVALAVYRPCSIAAPVIARGWVACAEPKIKKDLRVREPAKWVGGRIGERHNAEERAR